MKKPILIKAVEPEVKKAISDYCKAKGITQGEYLKKDRRIRPYLSTVVV